MEDLTEEDWLKIVAGQVAIDMQIAEPFDLRLEASGPPTQVDIRVGAPELHDVYIVDRRIPHAQAAADFAGYLQRYVFEHVKATKGQPLPRCPGHHHAAVATVLDDLPWWVCPDDQRPLAPFGRFADTQPDA